jgi:prepilin-type N-terminal cleavage/methylation domain-containing protein
MRHPASGHTLWEMLLALALLAVIAAIVAPAIPSRARDAGDDVARTANDLVAMLGQARLTALQRGTTVDVVLDPASARVWTFVAVDGERRIASAGRLPLAPGAMLVAAEPRVRFTFDATGTAAGGPVTVRGAGAAQSVSVDPWSGAAHAESR